VLATAAMDDINELLPHPIDKQKQYDTLAGYLIDKFGRIPGVRETLQADGYEFTIMKRNKTSITAVQMRDLLNGDAEKSSTGEE
jgi:CBS domain containing-hemolysin-like protein